MSAALAREAPPPMAVRAAEQHGSALGASQGAILAFDFGLRRIGVALAERSIGIAHPLAAIAFEDNRRRLEAIAALIAEWRPALLIIGCPRGTDGMDEAHALAAPIRRFARRLHARFGLPVELVDEHLSSWEASRKLSRAGLPAHAQKARVDSMAACTILETWLATRDPARASTEQGR